MKKEEKGEGGNRETGRERRDRESLERKLKQSSKEGSNCCCFF